ncbi:hypothetical protein [Ktedonobacter robiniae]|uniref:Uncharacterized protein n=1 Tax=Ktedonobacter robiniae TaxID=2778365 RepID=A0ABQ3UM61_9CHLR|nr:hypothetical protein [Ktedonobacter robiniae]GHO53763.1 hypothetical protein KSB_22380 [Ktedonobacter robiniae]
MQQSQTYLLAFRRSVTFRSIEGKTTFISSAEIVPGVKLIQKIPATREAPALYELALTLDGEPKVLIVQKNLIELRKEKLLQKIESSVTQ